MRYHKDKLRELLAGSFPKQDIFSTQKKRGQNHDKISWTH